MTSPIDEYLEERQDLSPRTIASYRWALRDAERRIRKDLSGISSRDLSELSIAWRHNDQLLSHLRNFLRWAGHPLAESVPHGIAPENRRRLVWYAYAEVEAAVDACRTPRERLVLHLALELMYRRIEIERAVWTDFQETSILVHGKAQKGRGEKPRRIPWHQSTRQLLEAYRENPTECPYRSTSRPRPRTVLGLRKSALDKLLKTVGTRAGLGRPLQFHALRRTGGRLFVQAGIRAGKAPLLVLIELQHVYGHEDLRTTLKYIGWELEEAAETMALMPRLEASAAESPMQIASRT